MPLFRDPGAHETLRGHVQHLPRPHALRSRSPYVLTPSGAVHPTLTDGSLKSRDVAQVLEGQRIFVRAFAQEDVAREALATLARALDCLSGVGALLPDFVEALDAAINNVAALAQGDHIETIVRFKG